MEAQSLHHLKSARKLALAIFIVVAVWFVSGIFFKPSVSANSQHQATSKSKLPKVQTTALKAQSRLRMLVVNGVTEPPRTLELKSELAGRIDSIYRQEGTYVKQAQPIARLQIRTLPAQLEQAKALIAQRELEYKAAQKLSKQGLQSETQLAASLAALEREKVVKQQVEIDMQNTMFRAPWPGFIERLHVERGQVVDKNDVIFTLIQTDPFLMIGQISQLHVGELRKNMQATVTLADGREFKGKIRFIGKVADSLTRTVRIEVAFETGSQKIVSGVSGELSIPLTEVSAHHIAPSFLSLNDAGVIGVKILDTKSKQVAFIPVTIEDETDGKFWVSGLPKEISLITLGHAFVMDGQQVEASVQE